ncbi:undecaprenyl-phosphate glucose phosphotransferase [Mucilaginibacter sp. PAMB04168]|uniref:undecaprenyl-phosphate glucose phosphotransferase n=1 Tax=Mucilaginibacter sp. PAMB04168 TaxID=3138567 RepID=UPI0031F6781A
MQNRYLYSLRIILAAVDFVCINIAFIIAYHITVSIHYNFSADYYLQLLFVNNLLWVLNANFMHLYHKKTVYSSKLLFALRWKCGLVHLTFFAAYILITSQVKVSVALYLLFYLLLNIHLLCSQLTYRLVEPILKLKFRFKKPIALVGISETSDQLANFLRRTHARYDLKSFLDQHDCLIVNETPMSLVATCEQIKNAADNGINDVYVAVSPEKTSEIDTLLVEAHNQCVRLKLVPHFNESLPQLQRYNHISNLSVINANTEPFEEMNSRFVKRVFDLVFSALVIVFILSWLYPLLAIIIKIQSPGPVLFRQLRSGKNNREFWCYKFRSMRVNDEADHKQASRDDSRVTAIGKFMRRTSLDEFPQFFNVLLGNMSIVGPRPHMVKHTQHYRNVIDKYMVRHYLKPGITGWAQVNGFRGETRETESMAKRVEHDIWYLENWSVSLDLRIIFYTVANIFKSEQNAF